MGVIGFLEICGALFVLYVFTQLFLPLLFPNSLEYNWIFKKDKTKDLGKKAEQLKQSKQNYLKEVNAVKTQSKIELEKAKQTEKELRNLK